MFTFVGAACVGVFLAGIYTLLLVVMTTGSSIFSRMPYMLRIVGGVGIRMGIVAIAVMCMLLLSINHLILMMIAFYATVVIVMIAYKGAG